MKIVSQLLLAVALISLTNSSLAGMILSFDSSDQSWVGQGESHTVSTNDGYTFSGGEKQRGNALSFRIASLNSPFGPDWDPRSGERYNYWTLSLAAPFSDILSVGHYNNTARYPFQSHDQPGLTFSGNHRGNNRNSGFFEILDISFDDLGNVDSLAVDFTQHGETNPNWWITGQFRFNSDIALSSASVPEPASILLIFIGFSALLFQKKRREFFNL